MTATAPARTDQLAHDLVFTFTFETYSDAVARGMNRPPDRFLQTALASPRVRRLLVANPFRSAPRRFARMLAGKGDTRFPSTERAHLVTPLRLAKLDPTSVPRLRALYSRYSEALRRAAWDQGLQRPALVTASPFPAGFSQFEWCENAVFYARDDWAELPARRAWWPAIRAAYREMAASGRSVVAVSQQILDRIEPTGPSRVVPNGVEPAEWRGVQPEDPTWLAAVPHPRALYVGTLDTRLDMAGLRTLAAARPDLHIVLLGTVGDPEPLRGIESIPNIHVKGPVGRADLVAAIRNSELCLVSHRRTPLTEAMSPLKIYEYLAGGKPVLSIDLAPCRGISDRVLLSETVADFVDLVDPALALGDQPEPDRLSFVSDNSWTSRHRDILDVAFGQ